MIDDNLEILKLVHEQYFLMSFHSLHVLCEKLHQPNTSYALDSHDSTVSSDYAIFIDTQPYPIWNICKFSNGKIFPAVRSLFAVSSIFLVDNSSLEIGFSVVVRW